MAIEIPDPSSPGDGPAGTIVVATEGGDFTSIQAAMNAAASGQTVLVYPGTYAENLDFTSVASNVRVTGFPNAQNVILSGADTTSSRVILNQAGTIREINVVGPSSGAAPAVDCTGLGAGQLAVVFNVALQGGGGTGALLKGAGSGIVAVVGGAYHNGGTAGSFIEITGGVFIADNLITNVGTVDDALNVSGGVVAIDSMIAQQSALYSATDYIELSGGATTITSLLLQNGSPCCTTAIHISGDGATCEIDGAPLQSVTNDFLVDGALAGTGSTINISCRLDFAKTSIPAGYRDVANTRLNFGTTTGWALYTDTANTSGSPQALSSNTRTQWTNNAGSKITTYRPGVQELFASNEITPAQVGEAYIARINMTVDNYSGNPTLTCDVDIGSDPFGASSDVITRDTRTLRSGGPRQISFNFSIFCLSTFLSNGGAIGVECTSNADIYGKSILLTRIH